MRAYELAIFGGAFLLFQVQPLIGEYILPWFGGAPGVWTACMLFFQTLLLAGYAYAHVVSRCLKPRTQAGLHLALLAVALALLPLITPAAAWKPSGAGDPTVRILALLAVSLGLPYFVLSATSPLLQAWFSRLRGGRSPYRFYALSNAGSLLALVSYPILFQPQFTRQARAGLWGCGLATYAVCCAACALRLWRSEVGGQKPEVQPQTSGAGSRAQPSAFDRLLWVLLPGCASVLLLATTNKLCEDVAVVPFLWVLPLALYLSSFILCFDSPRWYMRFPFTLALVGAEAGICWALFQGTHLSVGRQVAIYAAGLFVCCMVCHGELYRLRPAPEDLTAFYLLSAAGGALGGVLVGVVAPLVFRDYYELQLGLWSCGLLFLVVCVREGWRQTTGDRALAWALTVLGLGGLSWFLGWFGEEPGQTSRVWFNGWRAAFWVVLAALGGWWVARQRLGRFRRWPRLKCAWLLAGLVALSITLWLQGLKTGGGVVWVARNFYGVLTVYDCEPADPERHHLRLQHGRITHGLQFVDAERARWPTGYYSEDSGVGRAWRALPAGARRIGLVGLGTGTLTAYGRPGDYVRIYEINPEIKRLAASRFSYLSNCPSRAEVTLGDARVSLEREPGQEFDLLAVDAFSSGAVPVHLLTREAFVVYQRHMKPNGVIAVHVSNEHLDLAPVVAQVARYFNYKAAAIDHQAAGDKWWVYPSRWILLTHNQEFLQAPAIREAAHPLEMEAGRVRLWTDDFASLFQILK